MSSQAATVLLKITLYSTLKWAVMSVYAYASTASTARMRSPSRQYFNAAVAAAAASWCGISAISGSEIHVRALGNRSLVRRRSSSASTQGLLLTLGIHGRRIALHNQSLSCKVSELYTTSTLLYFAKHDPV